MFVCARVYNQVLRFRRHFSTLFFFVRLLVVDKTLMFIIVTYTINDIKTQLIKTNERTNERTAVMIMTIMIIIKKRNKFRLGS